MNTVQGEVIAIKASENTRELILEASKQIAHEEGLSNLSMRNIAKKCGIALGTIYNYYPTKIDIILAIVEDFWKECFIGFNSKLDRDMDFFDKLQYLYIHMKDYIEDFEENWLHDLSNLPYSSKTKAKEKEMEFGQEITNIFKNMLIAHKEEFSQEVFEKYSEDEIAIFIRNNFMILLKSNNKNYGLFDFTLKKILT